jgi:hypothetical protein
VAGAKAFSCCGKNDHAYVFISGNFIESALEGGQHFARQQVHLRRAIHRQRGDAVAVFPQQDGLLLPGLCAHG